ncbi:MAG: EAL domain-containing protein [Acidobacteriota bacterium]|nr:EAL domain-containing protein [Acidobacteriota bacterium]MDQ7087795.1 EAL domain-containing protein [Acidobacteriota bacterium]
MAESKLKKSPRATLPDLAREIDQVFAGAARPLDQLLARSGSIGLIRVGMEALDAVEARFGAGARSEVAAQVERLVQSTLGGTVTEQDRFTHGPGEIVVMFFRPSGDQDFFDHRLPGLAMTLRRQIEKHRQQLVFPYLRPAPRLDVGWGLAPHNAAVRPGKTIAVALEQARRDGRIYAEASELEEFRELATLVIHERIRPVFEPIVHLPSRTVYGVEALSRGPRGSIWESPAHLFGVARKANSLFELDVVCRRIALRELAGHIPANQVVFLNCMPSALLDPSFSGRTLEKTLEACGLHPHQVILEINEQESIQNSELFHKAVHHYRQVGIRIALDDVGSGYASLSSILDTRPDLVKIDLSLVRSVDKDPAREELVYTLVKLAHRIDAACVAEGVETKAELETLEKLELDYVQGYLFSRPTTLENALSPDILREAFS